VRCAGTRPQRTKHGDLRQPQNSPPGWWEQGWEGAQIVKMLVFPAFELHFCTASWAAHRVMGSSPQVCGRDSGPTTQAANGPCAAAGPGYAGRSSARKMPVMVPVRRDRSIRTRRDRRCIHAARATTRAKQIRGNRRRSRPMPLPGSTAMWSVIAEHAMPSSCAGWIDTAFDATVRSLGGPDADRRSRPSGHPPRPDPACRALQPTWLISSPNAR
jgi:hypothetical protein